MKAIVERLLAARNFEILTHAGPDADAVGSTRALGLALQALGKRVSLRYPTPVPTRLDFTTSPATTEDFAPELSLLLDVSDLAMLEGLKPSAEIAVIDHHLTNAGFGACNWIDSTKSSTAEMIGELLPALGVSLTPAIATNLYMGLFGDTGGFMHANTTANVFATATRLSAAGADTLLVAARLRSRSEAYFKLLGRAVERLVCVDAVYASYLTQTELETAGYDEADGLVETLATIEDAAVMILLKQKGPDEVRASLRSRGEAAGHVAQAFGGGGHARAAGFTASGQAADLLPTVMNEARKWI